MSRKARKFNRPTTPDPKFNSVVIAKFINHIMLDGKKALASNIVYTALDGLTKIANEKKGKFISVSCKLGEYIFC